MTLPGLLCELRRVRPKVCNGEDGLEDVTGPGILRDCDKTDGTKSDVEAGSWARAV